MQERLALTLLLSLIVLSTSSKSIEMIMNSTDFSGDGVQDTFYYQASPLKEIKERKEADLNNNGKIDFWTTYDSVQDLKKTTYEWDSNGDGKRDKREVRLSNGEVQVDRDLDFDGLYDWKKTVERDSIDLSQFRSEKRRRDKSTNSFQVISSSTFKTIQADAEGNIDYGYCSLTSEDLMNLRQFDIFDNILDYNLSGGISRNGIFTTSYGHQIDEACFSIYGKENFLGLVKRGITEGAACLQKLGTPKATEHLHKLTDMLRGRFGGPKIDCQTEAVNKQWNHTTMAQGRIGVGQMWLRPNYRELYYDNASSPEVARTNLASTIFHEMLHNIGYAHNEGIEYVYTCQRCCHGKASDNEAETQAACNICKSDYAPDQTVEYLTNLAAVEGLNPAISFNDGLTNFLNQDANSNEMLLFIYQQTDDDFLRGVGRARAIRAILRQRGIDIGDEGRGVDQNQYIPYESYIAEDETGNYQKLASAHEASFLFLNLKSLLQDIPRRDRARRDERRELVNRMYDNLMSFDLDSIDLSGDNEEELRLSMQNIVETYINAIDDVNRSQRISSLMRPPRSFNSFLQKHLRLKQFFKSNARAIQALSING